MGVCQIPSLKYDVGFRHRLSALVGAGDHCDRRDGGQGWLAWLATREWWRWFDSWLEWLDGARPLRRDRQALDVGNALQINGIC